jgi:hypothetical protein
VVIRESDREAARRVASTAKSALEEAVVEVVNTFLKDLLEYLAYVAVSNWDEAQRVIVERGIDPDAEAVLGVLEELADRVDFDSALSSADPNTKRVVNNVLAVVFGLARRFAPREWIEKFTYENALRKAQERGIVDVVKYLEKYPKLSSRLIDWVRSKLLSAER